MQTGFFEEMCNLDNKKVFLNSVVFNFQFVAETGTFFFLFSQTQKFIFSNLSVVSFFFVHSDWDCIEFPNPNHHKEINTSPPRQEGGMETFGEISHLLSSHLLQVL